MSRFMQASAWLLLLVWCVPITSSASSTQDQINSIEVFTIAGEPVVNVPDGVPVIELDAPARLDAELSHGLPDDIDKAKAEMQSRLQSPEWRGKLQQYGDLYTGVARAWMLRVEKVPAVVVDSRYVIYGETDVAAAVARANGYIEREGIQ